MADVMPGNLLAAGEEETDGRRRRRARNRMAAVEALIALYGEGHLEPSAAEIAERAGLSPRSLFRYFDDVDDLVRAGIEHRAAIIRPLIEQRIGPDSDRSDRIARLVALRLDLHATVGTVGRVARLRAWHQPLIADNLAAMRRALRRQTRDVFAPELDDLTESERRRVVGAIELLTSYEAVELALNDQVFTSEALRLALETDIDALLSSTGRRS